jgi:FkbM family methyltransferase
MTETPFTIPTGSERSTAAGLWRRAAANPRVRRIAVPLLSRLNLGDITIHHHWTGDPLLLHSFRHKGYWFHGTARERDLMISMARLVPRSAVVFDIGGHIGYTALYLAALADAGEVHVFEPGSNNLHYLRTNLTSRHNVILLETAVGDRFGEAEIGLESLSGQNNSLVADMDTYERSAGNAYLKPPVRRTIVKITTIDHYCNQTGTRPSLVKIDTEGFEYEVLQGASETLRSASPVLMVELSRHIEDVITLLRDAGYDLFDARLRRIQSIPDRDDNVFCLKPAVHSWAYRFLNVPSCSE